MPNYQVVRFQRTDEIELVPVLWLVKDDHCVWPPYHAPSRMRRAIVDSETPSNNWTTFLIAKIGKEGNEGSLHKERIL